MSGCLGAGDDLTAIISNSFLSASENREESPRHWQTHVAVSPKPWQREVVVVFGFAPLIYRFVEYDILLLPTGPHLKIKESVRLFMHYICQYLAKLQDRINVKCLR